MTVSPTARLRAGMQAATALANADSRGPPASIGSPGRSPRSVMEASPPPELWGQHTTTLHGLSRCTRLCTDEHVASAADAVPGGGSGEGWPAMPTVGGGDVQVEQCADCYIYIAAAVCLLSPSFSLSLSLSPSLSISISISLSQPSRSRRSQAASR